MTSKVVAEAMETSEWADDCGRGGSTLRKLAEDMIAGLAQECAKLVFLLPDKAGYLRTILP